MPKKKTNTKTKAAPRPPASLLLSLLRAAVISLGCGIVLLFALCAILLGTDDPGACAQTAAALIPLPVAVLCGVLSAKQSALGGLPSGILGGGLLCVLLFALGAVIPGGDMSAMPMLLTAPVRAAACLLLSAVGGYCVTHKKPRVRRRHP